MGYANGTIEARKHRTGDLIHKSTIGEGGNPISKLFYYDYRMEGLP